MAPISYAFIGSYFLNPYLARFGDALNLASERVLAQVDGGHGDDDGYVRSEPQRASSPPYTLVRAKNVGMTAILLYARDPASVGNIQEAECGFGAADMGNKGAVGLRVTWTGGGRGGGGAHGQPAVEEDDGEGGAKSTELTFVATHLAAMEWNVKKRNANWRSIVSSLLFANPRDVLPPGVFPADTSTAPTPDRSGAGDTAPAPPPLQLDSNSTSTSELPSEDDDDEGADTHPLLSQQQSPGPDSDHDETHRSALQALSIFKPTSHLFLAGDLNYRIGETTPPPLAPFPSLDPSSPDYFPAYLPRDQLTRERLANRTCHGLSESPIAFGPTYKFDILTNTGAGDDLSTADNADAVVAGRREGMVVVPWRFARHRWPSWCDRVLWLDVAPWARQRLASLSSRLGKDDDKGGSRGVGMGRGMGIETTVYDALPVVATSDHRAVVWRGRVPVLGAREMALPLPAGDGDGDNDDGDDDGDCDGDDEVGMRMKDEWWADPRARMPVPVDVHAWERRASARRKELLVGWSALLWSTPEGALAMATVLALGVGSWWLWRSW